MAEVTAMQTTSPVAATTRKSTKSQPAQKEKNQSFSSRQQVKLSPLSHFHPTQTRPATTSQLDASRSNSNSNRDAKFVIDYDQLIRPTTVHPSNVFDKPYVTDDSKFRTIPMSSWPNFDKPFSHADMNYSYNPYDAHNVVPKGSVFHNFSEEEVERLRFERATKRATNTSYFNKCQQFRTAQEKRAFVPPNQYYEMLRIKALNASDKDRAERIALAGQMFVKHAMGALKSHFDALNELTEKSKRAKRFLLKRMAGGLRQTFMAWQDITRKYKRVRHFVNKHMADALTRSYAAWKVYVQKNNKIKKMFGNHMAKIEHKNFMALKVYVKRSIFTRKKLAKFLVGAKVDKFLRWKKFAETSRRIKNLVGKHFVGMLRTTFLEWFNWAGKSIKIKRLLASHFLGLQKIIFLSWRGVTELLKKERGENVVNNQEFNPADFFSIDSWGLPSHQNVPNLRPSYRGPQTKFRNY